MILPIIIVFVFIVILIIVLKIPISWVNWIKNYIDDPRPRISLIYIITSLFTIFSIFFAVGVYFEQNSIDEDNDLIVLENLKKEIEGDLFLIDSFKQDEYTKCVEEDECTSMRFNYYFLEKSLGIIKDREVRDTIAVVVNDMRQVNRIMDYIMYLSLANQIKESNKYKDMKKYNINITNEANIVIERKLLFINSSLK